MTLLLPLPKMAATRVFGVCLVRFGHQDRALSLSLSLPCLGEGGNKGGPIWVLNTDRLVINLLCVLWEAGG